MSKRQYFTVIHRDMYSDCCTYYNGEFYIDHEPQREMAFVSVYAPGYSIIKTLPLKEFVGKNCLKKAKQWCKQMKGKRWKVFYDE